jgi:beta-galactosidase/beta-glucuronidase
MSKARRARVSAKKAATGGGHGYPRPQLQRDQWTNLNGPWDFAIDANAELRVPRDVEFDQEIQVPFAPETPMSGVENTDFYNAVWYRRVIETPAREDGQRVLLHFGAVDHCATVWVNDHMATTHVGGYTPFCADITDLLTEGTEQTIVVRAYDDPHDLAKPRGKQDWKREPHSIWYPRTTGIWQTVWMEVVADQHISRIRFTPTVKRWELSLHAWVSKPHQAGDTLRVRMHLGERVLVDDVYSVQAGEVRRSIRLVDPGIDDARNELFWTPNNPVLIDVDFELMDADGKVIDRVHSYTALRTLSLQNDRLTMNNRPLYLRLVLDQGYWKESGLTSPNDDALRKDVELIKAMGFNGVRKHQKIEDPRFLYWADKLGLFVWEEMPSAYSFSPTTVQRVTREWAEAIERDISHPCIIAWVPINESWGVPDLPESYAQRNFVRELYYLTKTLDPSRPCIGNDGWENIITDIVAIHDYDGDLGRIQNRYQFNAENLAKLFAHERPGNKQLVLENMSTENKPIMLTEFGGIAFSKDVKHTWGYRRADTQQRFAQQYTDLLRIVNKLPVFSGFCYTQFTDTYQEANGVLYMDRTPKFDIKKISDATTGRA